MSILLTTLYVVSIGYYINLFNHLTSTGTLLTSKETSGEWTISVSQNLQSQNSSGTTKTSCFQNYGKVKSNTGMTL